MKNILITRVISLLINTDFTKYFKKNILILYKNILMNFYLILQVFKLKNQNPKILLINLLNQVELIKDSNLILFF